MFEPPINARSCVCLSGEEYFECCGRFHDGEAEAATAEQLMRSRFSAFVLLDADYLMRTWHPDTAPSVLELDPGVEWGRLDILSTRRGGPLDTEGTMEFTVPFVYNGERGVHHETSSFVRENRRWYYVDAVLLA
jgi:SEC-C motif-containing protein